MMKCDEFHELYDLKRMNLSRKSLRLSKQSIDSTLQELTSISGWWAGATPLKNMSSSIGMISNSIYGKIKNV